MSGQRGFSGPVVLGISAHFHDSSACLLVGGELVAAASEERFSRVKQDPRLPLKAARYCLRYANFSIGDVDCLAYYEDPVKKLDRQLWMSLPDLPDIRPDAMFRLDASRPEQEIRQLLGYEGEIVIVDHHISHAASAYYYSGFDTSAILTVDAVGEWTTTSWGQGCGDDLRLLDEVRYPHSLGLFYSTLTGYLGFEVNEGEYKVMGLAPYGKPCYVDRLRQLISVDQDGRFELDLSYFDFRRMTGMASDRLIELLGHPPREPESELEQFHADVACGVQTVTEEVMLRLAGRAYELVPSRNLCMAGGVALNVVAVRRIIEEGPFAEVFVQPAAGDAGGALGAAAVAHRRLTGSSRRSRMDSALLGPAYSTDEVANLLSAAGTTNFRDFRGDQEALLDAVVANLADAKVVGWFHGRMEFGPRALGARSILADPRGDDTRDRINALVKLREGFRPFAPAVLAESAAEHFKLDHESPFMLETCQVISRLDLPAITHVDGSARVQTVHADRSPRFHRLIEKFDERTGCPILLNTSFNLRGEPIVCTPIDALLCFLRSAIDCLVVEDFLIERADVPKEWLDWFEGTRPPGGPVAMNTVYTLL